MQVKELRKQLKKMPGEMNVYSPDGTGLASVKHIWRINLVDMEQFCELRLFSESHTPQGENARIERETGFKTHDELITAYKELKGKPNA